MNIRLTLAAAIVGIVSGATAVGHSIYGLTQEVSILKSSVSALQDKARLTFETRDEFETAVAETINKFVAQRQKEEIDRKYARFEAAPDTVNSGKRIYGDINARFTLVEFSDMECPFCKQFHDIPKQIVDASKGNVNWQWKHLPLDFHNPAAYKEALAAECVAEQKGNRGFWVFISDVFNHTQGNGGGVTDLISLVTGVGANIDKFRECLASGKYEEIIQQDIQKATTIYGINGTPATFIVDNHTGKSQLLGGAQPVQAVMAVMSQMMEAQEEAEAFGTSDERKG